MHNCLWCRAPGWYVARFAPAGLRLSCRNDYASVSSTHTIQPSGVDRSSSSPLLTLPSCQDLEPDVLFVDGNGRLHPRGAGLACHLGVVMGLRTVGLGKTFLQVDGLTKNGVREVGLHQLKSIDKRL